MGDKGHLVIRTYSKNVLVNVLTISLVTDDVILQDVADGDQDDCDQHQDEGEPGLDPKRVESEKYDMSHSIGHSAQVVTDLECSFGYDDIATLSKSRVIVLRASPPWQVNIHFYKEAKLRAAYQSNVGPENV